MDWTNLLDERQQKELAFDRDYAENYAHGALGHNIMLIVAKLAEMLDRVEESGVDIPKLYEPKE